MGGDTWDKRSGAGENQNFLKKTKKKLQDLRVRCDANVVRSEPAIEPRPALIPNHLLSAVQHTLVRKLPGLRILLLLLQARFDKVKGQRHETREEARDGGGGERAVLGREGSVGLQLGLGLCEESQLTKVESHGADDGGQGAGPERPDALCFGDAG